MAAAEAASPVEAVESVTRELGVALGATKVSFLIADMSGRALVRLAHVHLSPGDGAGGGTPLAADERRALEESATVLRSTAGPPSRRCAPSRCRSCPCRGNREARSRTAPSPVWCGR